MSARPRTRLDPDVRRHQILDAATTLFREQGYSHVSVEAVAERAGVTRGLLHHYFGSKRALYLEVVTRAARIPPDVRLVPPGVTGDLAEVVAACVVSWMRMIRTAGGLWAPLADPGGLGGEDLDEVFTRGRDELVERMLDELPFPPELDRDLLASALRSYASLARVATEEWLVTRHLDEAQTETLLRETLLALVERVVPAMGDDGAG